jgi:hypothetical protein
LNKQNTETLWQCIYKGIAKQSKLYVKFVWESQNPLTCKQVLIL